MRLALLERDPFAVEPVELKDIAIWGRVFEGGVDPVARGVEARSRGGPMKIAFFGAGLMGAGFVRRMLDNGHRVNVWNRDPAKAKALEADGAKAFADAARGDRGRRAHPSVAVGRRLGRFRAGAARRRHPGVDLHHRPHDDRADADRRAHRALGRAGQGLHPRAGVHGPRQRARGDGHHARLGRSRPDRGRHARTRDNDGTGRSTSGRSPASPRPSSCSAT